MDGIRSIPIAPEITSRATLPVADAKGATSFTDELGKALNSVEGLQQTADQRSAELAMGGGNLHETSLALEKADIGLRVLTKVRNKILDAYQEVMRMSV